MPKTLFYSGVVASFLIAVLCGAQAIGWILGGAPSPLRFADSMRSEIALAVLLVLVALPVASLLIRIASLLAARNLFSALLASMFASCAILSSIVLASCEWRMAFVDLSSKGGLSRAHLLGQIRSVSLLIFGITIVLALLSIRPYFRAQANGILSTLLWLPGFALTGALLDQGDFDGATLAFAPTASSSFLLSLMSVIFGSIAVHCLRHRHSFIEVTNLRELLDSRIDPRAKRRGRFGFNSDVAFDS